LLRFGCQLLELELMKRTLITAAVCLVAATFGFAQTITSTVSEDNGATNNPPPPAGTSDGDQVIYSTPNHPAIVTQQAGYDFSSGANAFTNLSSITQITFTMTMFDGDSGPTDFDFNHLHLYLGAPSAMVYNASTGVLLTGGVDTGIVLNGFEQGEVDTLTFTIAVNSATSTAILSELSAGAGHIDAFVVSDNSADVPLTGGNEVIVGNDTMDATTTLTFTGITSVPEPSSWIVSTVGLIGIGFLRIRRSRANT
jgi:hypothetical protein